MLSADAEMRALIQGHALGCAERQIEAVHTARTQCAPLHSLRCHPRHPSNAPPAIWVGFFTAGVLNIPHRPTSRAADAGRPQPAATPGSGSRLGLAVVLAQTRRWHAARSRVDDLARNVGGVDVVVDRPPLQLRIRQQEDHSLGAGRCAHVLRRNHSRTLCNCAERILKVGGRVWISVRVRDGTLLRGYVNEG